MSPQSYYCIIGTFLQEIDFRVRFANNERAGTGGRDCPAVVRNPIAGRTPWSDRQTLEQTLLDSLYKPFQCGGPEVVFEAWQEGVASRRIDEERLVKYLRSMNYPATTRRVAVMLELAGGTPSAVLRQFLQASQKAIDRQSPHACISLLPGVDYQNLNESWLVSTP
jgi:hypothetical protein